MRIPLQGGSNSRSSGFAFVSVGTELGSNGGADNSSIKSAKINYLNSESWMQTSKGAFFVWKFD